MTATSRSRLVRLALVSSNATSALLLICAGLESALIDWLTPFLFLPLATTATRLFAASGVFAMVVAAVRLRTVGWKAVAPILVQAVVVVVLTTVPFGRIALDLDFLLHRGDRERVVELVRSGQIRTSGFGLATLPAQLAHVSRGGEIVVDPGGEVLFFTFRGVLDHYAAFVYSPADVTPEPDDGIPWREIEQRDRHWWWVSR